MTDADLAPVRQRLGLTTGAPVFYDVAIEDFREVTQADVDLWLRRLRDLKMHVAGMPIPTLDDLRKRNESAKAIVEMGEPNA